MGEMQVPADALYGAQVVGNDAVITFGGLSGNFELNTMLPVIADNLLQSIGLLANASRGFARRCVVGLQADVAKCRSNLEQSPARCAALAPVIGYDPAAGIATLAHETGRTVREVALERSGLGKAELEALLDPAKLTEPGLRGASK